MKKTKQKQNTFIQMLLVCFLMGSASAKSQSISNLNNQNYKSVIENNGEGDNYEQKKKNFISKNPDTYQSMSGEKINVNQKLKTQAEKDAILKKSSIVNVPEFKTQEEKTAYFQKNNLEKEIIRNNNDPTLPKMKNTGNSKKDAEDFEISKNIYYKNIEEKANRKPSKEEIDAKNKSLKERGISIITENN